MVKNFLGRGWRYPVGVDRDGTVSTSAYERNIEESIEIILGTAPGDLVFSPNNAETSSKCAYLVGEALNHWEPRVQGIEVNASPDVSEENRLNIDIHYQVRATNSVFNMVYPFYLRKEEKDL